MKSLLKVYNVIKKNNKVQRYALLVAATAFCVGLIFSIKSQPQLLYNLRYPYAFFCIFIIVPITLIANAIEFSLISSSAKQKVKFIKAFEISIIASAANMLPIPGGAITRFAWLKTIGVDIKKSSLIVFVFGLIWLGISFIFSGFCIIYTKHLVLASGFILLGIGILFFCGFTLIKLHASLAIILGAFLQRFILAILDALKFWFCFKASGHDVTFLQAGIFTISGVLGSAVSIVPAGFGVSEGVSALLAPIASIDPSLGFLAATAGRFFVLIFLSPLSIALALFKNKSYFRSRLQP